MTIREKISSIIPNAEARAQKRLERAEASGEALVERSPYYTSPSFIAHGGKVGTVVQLYSIIGSNRDMRFSDVIDFIPVDPMTDVDIYMFINDKLITGDEKKRIISSNASGNKDYFKNRDEGNKDERSADRTSEMVEAEQTEISDYDEYERLSGRPDPIVCFNIQLLVIGNSREAVEEQLKILNTSLDKRHPGAQWDSAGGDQGDRFQKLLDTYRESRLDMTATATNAARLNFGVSPGLTDRCGVPMGRDSMALSVTDSSVDFDRYLRTQAIIANPPGATMPIYELEADETNPPSLSSQIAQAASNQIMANGHRVHHLVLNDWDYHLNTERNYQIPAQMRRDIFAHYDVSKVTINMMEGFGEYENVVQIFNRLTRKIVNIFDVLQDMQISKEDKAVVLDVVRSFYENNRLWQTDANERPKNTNIINISNKEAYPTGIQLMSFFRNAANRADNQSGGSGRRSDNIMTLYSLLNQAVSANTAVLGRPTSIQPTDAPQVYYDFSRLGSDAIRQVQLLNMIEYVSYTADAGDLIVFHGMENVYAKVADYLHPAIRASQRKGVRFLFAFDNVSAPKSTVSNMTDIFSMHGTYYQNLDTNVDYTIIGRCEPGEVDEFSKMLNMKLSDSIIQSMQTKTKNQVLFHRSVGRVNNFILSQAII